MSEQPHSLRSIFYALAANSIIAVAKFSGAAYTGSSAMLAEAVHSLADCGNQGLLLLGLKQSAKPASSDHPLGHGKAIYFWSFIVALMLFSMGGLFSIYEGVHKLHNTEQMAAPWLAVGILVFSFFAEGASLAGCIREINKVRGDRSLWRWFRDSRQSELIVVLGEDIAALAGLAFALFAILLAMLTGNPIYDALGSIGIGVLLVIVAFGIGVEVKALLIGQSAEPRIEAEIKAFIEGHQGVESILNLITLQLGPDTMVAVKARMGEFADTGQMVAEINRCEAALKERFPQVKWLFFEPDSRA